MKIRIKIVLLSVIPMAAVLATIFFPAGNLIKNSEEELARARFEKTRKNMELSFNEHIAIIRPPLRETFISLILNLHEWGQLNTFFVRFASLYPQLERIALHSSGRRLAEMSRWPEGSFGKAQIDPETSLSNIFWLAGKPYVEFALPSDNDREVRGTIALAPFIEEAEKMTLTPGGSVKVYSTPPGSAPSGDTKAGCTEKRYPLLEGRWTLCLMEEESHGFYKGFRNGFVIFSLVALAFTFSLAMSFANNLTSRLEALASGSIAQGEGFDEISALEEKLSGFYDIKSKLKKQISSQESAGILGHHVAMIGHEFRNPIAAIKNAQYFIDSQLPPALKKSKIGRHLDIIKNEIKQISFMIEDLLSLSRLKPPVFALCDIGGILGECVEMFKQEYKLIDFELAVKKNLRAQADASEIRQVFANIIKNACEAITPPGEIKISASVDKNSIRIRFADSGCGIPADKIKEIWEPFISTKSSGMGFGLATVKKIVEERHKGTISLTSREGEGTKMTVYLPCEQQQL
ncbi:HAMP domain-containing histidine kinase [bacterium]|nr:HAMP domain-containing histidine kinase [bacterium]MBU3930817.1 HAMP domain-containing histidine kinase [bacterium]